MSSRVAGARTGEKARFDDAAAISEVIARMLARVEEKDTRMLGDIPERDGGSEA